MNPPLSDSSVKLALCCIYVSIRLLCVASTALEQDVPSHLPSVLVKCHLMFIFNACREMYHACDLPNLVTSNRPRRLHLSSLGPQQLLYLIYSQGKMQWIGIYDNDMHRIACTNIWLIISSKGW